MRGRLIQQFVIGQILVGEWGGAMMDDIRDYDMQAFRLAFIVCYLREESTADSIGIIPDRKTGTQSCRRTGKCINAIRQAGSSIHHSCLKTHRCLQRWAR